MRGRDVSALRGGALGWASGATADLIAKVHAQQRAVVRQVLWLFLGLVALTILLNVTRRGLDLQALAANGLLAALIGVGLWLTRAGRVRLALGLIIAFVMAVSALPLLLYGLSGTQGAWFLFFVPIVLSAVMLSRRALLLTGGVSVLALLAGYGLERANLTPLQAPFASPDPVALALQAAAVLVIVVVFLERFGLSLYRALFAAAEREERLGREVAERQRAEARYRILLENVPDAAIYLVDREERIVAAEGTAMRQHGLSPSDLEGQTVRGFLGDELYQEIGPYYQAAVAGRAASGEASYQGVDYAVRTAPLRGADGEVEGGIALVLDISEEKRARLELERALAAEARALKAAEAERRHLQGLFDYAPAMMATASGPQHVFTQANRAFLRLTGRQDVIGRSVLEVFPELADTEIPAALERVYQTGQPFVASEMLIPLDRDGDGVPEACYFDLIYQAMRDADGAVTGILALAHDVTEQVSARQELEVRQAKLERLNDELSARVGRLAALRAVDLAITGSASTQVVMDVVLNQVLRRLEVDAAQILLYRASSHDLRPAARIGFADALPPQYSLPTDRGALGQIVSLRAPRYIPDITAPESGFVPRPGDALEGFVSYFGVAIAAKGELLGVLELFHRRSEPRSDDWFEFAEALALQTAIALHNARLLEGLTAANEQLRMAYDTTIAGWARALDLKDEETAGHSQRVTDLTVALARHLGLGEGELEHVRRGAQLHDIGKMAVPDRILLKPGKLDAEEWAVMKSHTTVARDLLAPIAFLRPALEIPYSHHEKWDGSGYPQGLKGEQIPLAARIFAVVDVYDALSSDRPYRKAWSREKALKYIREQAGSHFDPAVVAAFLDFLEGNGL